MDSPNLAPWQKIGLLSTEEEFRNDNRTSGARLLVLRYFDQALDDLFIYHPVRCKGRAGALIYEDARRWFDSEEQHFLSFEWVCAHIRWDTASARKRIHAAALTNEPLRLRLQTDAGSGNMKVSSGFLSLAGSRGGDD